MSLRHMDVKIRHGWKWFLLVFVLLSIIQLGILIGLRVQDNITSLKLPQEDLHQDVKIISKGNHDYIDSMDGFTRAAQFRKRCSKLPKRSPYDMQRLLGNIDRQIVYCPVEKIGSTFWRRFLYLLTSEKTMKAYRQPFNVRIQEALSNERLYTLPIITSRADELPVRLMENTSLSFFFVRGPYERLLSAYIDKIVAPNPYYWKHWGIEAIRKFRKESSLKPASGADLTFPEFMKYVISLEKNVKNQDSHLHSIYETCRPCSIHYDFIGTMETFKKDATYIYQRFMSKVTSEAFEESFKSLSVFDAVVDSVKDPFFAKKKIVKLMKWETALKRIWLKLQLRGIISFTKPFPVSVKNISKTTYRKLVSLALTAHAQSDPEELKHQKWRVITDAYSSVPTADLEEFKQLFRHDFTLNGYDEDPDFIQTSRKNYVPQGYFDLSFDGR